MRKGKINNSHNFGSLSSYKIQSCSPMPHSNLEKKNPLYDISDCVICNCCKTTGFNFLTESKGILREQRERFLCSCCLEANTKQQTPNITVCLFF